jgi:hypothetical protein
LRPASLLIWLELVIFESWQRFSCWQLSSVPYSFQFLTIPAVSSSLLSFPVFIPAWVHNCPLFPSFPPISSVLAAFPLTKQ